MRPPRGAFIVGVARSGTSLLLSLLDGHPDVMRLPHETHVTLWHHLPDPVGGLFAKSKFGPAFPEGSEERARFEAALRDRLPGPAPVSTALLALVESCALARPPAGQPSLWVEKTPRHLRILPELLAALGPATRAVVLVRDPRATLASQKARWGHAGPREAGAFARRWALADALAHRLARQHEEVLLLRYEDLVRDTERCMRDVAEHLGIAFDPLLLQPTRRGEQWSGNSSYKEQRDGISPASLERWRESLTAEEVASLERRLASRMRAWSYEPGLQAPGPAWLRWQVEGAVALQLWRQSRSWRREIARLRT